ncbi:3-oxoacyl-[acyl-carrier-protein] synthase 2 [Formosa sp. Hel1_33_131]|nr:3-oxoacyl-[acyl-carrier-protein] synthase 2 [Formosa sp. Hel1_33_131]
MSMASISALGSNDQQIWEQYLTEKHNFINKAFDGFESLVSALSDNDWKVVNLLKESAHYKDLDPSVLLAIDVSRKAIAKVSWNNKSFGINIGSSRGATTLFEKYHSEFIHSKNANVSTLSSPTTTLGNISSWVGHDLQSNGPTISHSIACSTALHAVLNGIAWITSGMADRFLVGGCEASNTPFTIAQMKALKIYSNDKSAYPCKTLDFNKKQNTMIVGEGAAVFCLEKGSKKNAIAIIEGIGYATEPLKHNISISTNADCFQKSMAMAMSSVEPETIDVIVMHAPGTIKGDTSEYNAIKLLFKDKTPALTSNKWKIGHTLGASGGLSLELAIRMLQQQQFISIPFLKDQKHPNKIKKILVNAVGFGGNAVSLLLSIN